MNNYEITKYLQEKEQAFKFGLISRAELSAYYRECNVTKVHGITRIDR